MERERNIANMVWQGLRKYWERIIAGALILAVVGLWISAQFMATLFVELAIILLLGLVLERLIRASESKPRATIIHPDQAADQETEGFVSSIPLSSEVKLIEYSSASIQGTLKDLAKKRCDMKLLLCNPFNALSKFQADQRICQAIRTLRTEIPIDARIQIKCYGHRGEQASIRGRKFGNQWIQLGWYTYEQRPDMIPAIPPPHIWGHDNPVVSLGLASEEGRHLESMFDRVFSDLWESRNSQSLKNICGLCGKKSDCFGPDADGWLDHVTHT